jgi:Flp pilus assembly protein TadG
MISSFKRLWRDRRGNSLAIAGAALPLVLGSAGLASDTIQWTLWKRQLQRAADSAAMAGVYAKASGNAVGTCTDISGSTYSNPVAYDLKKNYKLKMTPTCVVTNPPASGTYASDANAVRVALAISRKLSFSGLFMSTPPTIRATALATVVPSGVYCVVSLENGAVTGINATGSTDVDLGCGMITNSTSMTAAVATGSSEVTASPIAAVGGIPASTHWGDGTILQPFTLAQEDPFANVDVPAYDPASCGDFPNNHQNGPAVHVDNPTGVRCFDDDMDINGTVTLDPGVYILDAADLVMTNNQGRLSCTGCTIIFTSSTAATDPSSIGVPNVNGGRLNLEAPDTGCTRGTAGCYDGIMMYQDRRAPVDNAFTINGNNGSTLEGAFYFPRADFTYNGNAGMTTTCLQIVTKRVQFTGSSAISNVCPDHPEWAGFTGKRIRLVE